MLFEKMKPGSMGKPHKILVRAEFLFRNKQEGGGNLVESLVSGTSYANIKWLTILNSQPL